MKRTKNLLFLAIVLALLALAIAAPVLAAEATPMWVSQMMVTYTGRSSGGQDSIMAYVHIRDANYERVEGAEVSAVWTLPDGREVDAMEPTEFQGIAKFRIFEGAGNYKLCVTGVTEAGHVYDPSLNGETCATYILPPYNPAW